MESTTSPAPTFLFRGKDGQRLKIDHTTQQRVKQQSNEGPISYTDDSISKATSTTPRPLWKPSPWRPPSPIYGGGEALIEIDSTVHPTTTGPYLTSLQTIQTTTPFPLKSTSTQSSTTKATSALSHTKTSDQLTRKSTLTTNSPTSNIKLDTPKSDKGNRKKSNGIENSKDFKPQFTIISKTSGSKAKIVKYETLKQVRTNEFVKTQVTQRPKVPRKEDQANSLIDSVLHTKKNSMLKKNTYEMKEKKKNNAYQDTNQFSKKNVDENINSTESAFSPLEFTNTTNLLKTPIKPTLVEGKKNSILINATSFSGIQSTGKPREPEVSNDPHKGHIETQQSDLITVSIPSTNGTLFENSGPSLENTGSENVFSSSSDINEETGPSDASDRMSEIKGDDFGNIKDLKMTGSGSKDSISMVDIIKLGATFEEYPRVLHPDNIRKPLAPRKLIRQLPINHKTATQLKFGSNNLNIDSPKSEDAPNIQFGNTDEVLNNNSNVTPKKNNKYFEPESLQSKLSVNSTIRPIGKISSQTNHDSATTKVSKNTSIPFTLVIAEKIEFDKLVLSETSTTTTSSIDSQTQTSEPTFIQDNKTTSLLPETSAITTTRASPVTSMTNLQLDNTAKFKPFPAINKLIFSTVLPGSSSVQEYPIKTSDEIQHKTPTIIPDKIVDIEVGSKSVKRNRQKSYQFDSIDFFNRYYKTGWDSPQDVKSKYNVRNRVPALGSETLESKRGSVPLTQVGSKPFKLHPRKYHGTQLPYRYNKNLNLSLGIKNDRNTKINRDIPDFLKYAIPMEKITPAMSSRRMDAFLPRYSVLPGYSSTRYFNRKMTFGNSGWV